MDLGLKNAEGYYDLTAYEAIKNVTEEERRKKCMNNFSLLIINEKNLNDCKEERMWIHRSFLKKFIRAVTKDL